MLAATSRLLAQRCHVRAAAAADRTFFTGVFSDHPGQSPLTEEFAGVPVTQPTTRGLGKTNVTTLSNGLRVASQETEFPVASVGVYVDAGSRCEDDSTSGISYMLQRLAFKSTQTRSHLRLVRDSEEAGVTLSAASGRDALVFSGEAMRSSTGELVEMLGESVVSPLLAEWEMYAWQEKAGETDPEDIAGNVNIALSEATHAAAFQDDSPLGRASFPTAAAFGAFSPEALRGFITSNFSAERMVVAGAGVDHAEFCSLVEAQFGGVPATSEGASGASPYLGGEIRAKSGGGLAYYSLSFAGPSLNAPAGEIAAANVLAALLGNTVTGTDGLGDRQSRLAVLEAGDASVGVATAYTRNYRDSGLFGVYAAADSDAAGNSFNKVAAALKGISSVSAEELTRAKNQAKMAAACAVETTTDIRNDIGTQLLLTGSRAEPAAVAAAIDGLTAADVQRAADTILASAPSVASVGAISNIPRYAAVQGLFN